MGESKCSPEGLLLQQALSPFYQRASQAEDRLSRLEAALAKEKDTGNEELLKRICQLESELEQVKSQVVTEREKARKFEAENTKNQYRIVHLVRALNEVDIKAERESS
ncbi:hypothetical protein MLD38_015927 [Melastoma candidum]|uniref:Uncharacterized protein n=1 Tax=Melastoma candidum TaxID=119954 RepID=A0ACB9RHX2_9MYRT|nr:hypothetical protein MLD38_015927 [Melastoma candidum]